jgi:uncharacterized protein YdaU (DUF1376 family)
MAGLSRFDFYPRDWHLDTRDLSNAAKGVYVDLLASMYARGGPLPADESELCRLCGCATVRSLRPLLSELLAKGKLKLVAGELINGRAMEEIAKADRQKAVASKGGKAKAQTVRAEYSSNTTGTQAETRPDIEENQRDNLCPPSPSPSIVLPLSSKEAADAAPAPSKVDPQKPVYELGKRLLGSGGQVTNLIRHHGGDLAATMYTLQLAEGKAEPREYIGAILRGDRPPETDWDAEYRRMGVS